jgi:hypothetical protein
LGHAGNHYVAVRGLQEPQLHDDEKQEEALRADGDEEVLQFVPEAYGAQGSEVTFSFLRTERFWS